MIVVRRLGALALGAVFGWAFMTQPLQLSFLVGMACVWLIFRVDRLAAAVLLGSVGVAVAAVGAAAETGPSLPWIVAGAAIAVLTLRAYIVHGNAWAADPQFVPARKRIVGLLAIMALVVGAVGLPVRPTEYSLPSAGVPPWLGFGCAGVGLDAVVRGSPGDDRHVWLENQLAVDGLPSHQRRDVLWPLGFRARFTHGLEVLDAWGNVVARDGSHISGGCVGANDEVAILPPYN